MSQVSGEREFFAQMVVDAVTALDASTLDLKMIGMKKVRPCSSAASVHISDDMLCTVSSIPQLHTHCQHSLGAQRFQ